MTHKRIRMQKAEAIPHAIVIRLNELFTRQKGSNVVLVTNQVNGSEVK